MCWFKSDPWGIFAHFLQAAPLVDIIQSNGKLLLREPDMLNFRVVPTGSPGALRKAARSSAQPGWWYSGPAPPLPQFQLKPSRAINKEVLVLQNVLIYDSSSLGGKTQPKDLIEKFLLSSRILIFIIINSFHYSEP